MITKQYFQLPIEVIVIAFITLTILYKAKNLNDSINYLHEWLTSYK